jgi:hypothetical protein
MANKSKMTNQGEKTSFGEKNRDQKFIFTAGNVKTDFLLTYTID